MSGVQMFVYLTTFSKGSHCSLLRIVEKSHSAQAGNADQRQVEQNIMSTDPEQGFCQWLYYLPFWHKVIQKQGGAQAMRES
jgi:hypothetical protein